MPGKNDERQKNDSIQPPSLDIKKSIRDRSHLPAISVSTFDAEEYNESMHTGSTPEPKSSRQHESTTKTPKDKNSKETQLVTPSTGASSDQSFFSKSDTTGESPSALHSTSIDTSFSHSSQAPSLWSSSTDKSSLESAIKASSANLNVPHEQKISSPRFSPILPKLMPSQNATQTPPQITSPWQQHNLPAYTPDSKRPYSEILHGSRSPPRPYSSAKKQKLPSISRSEKVGFGALEFGDEHDLPEKPDVSKEKELKNKSLEHPSDTVELDGRQEPSTIISESAHILPASSTEQKRGTDVDSNISLKPSDDSNSAVGKLELKKERETPKVSRKARKNVGSLWKFYGIDESVKVTPHAELDLRDLPGRLQPSVESTLMKGVRRERSIEGIDEFDSKPSGQTDAEDIHATAYSSSETVAGGRNVDLSDLESTEVKESEYSQTKRSDEQSRKQNIKSGNKKIER